jgi:hypothetical protein
MTCSPEAILFSSLLTSDHYKLCGDPISNVNVNLGGETFCDLKLHGTLVRITTCAETYSPL